MDRVRIDGLVVQRARERAGLNQTQLAAKAHVGRTSVAHLERGRQTVALSTARLVAKALDIPMESFVLVIETSLSDVDRRPPAPAGAA